MYTHCWNSSCLAVTWPLRGLQLPIILYAGAYSIGCCLLEDRGYIRDYGGVHQKYLQTLKRPLVDLPRCFGAFLSADSLKISDSSH
jgi:hypothetical protein